MRIGRLASLLLALSAVGCGTSAGSTPAASAPAPSPSATSAYVLRLGNDTLAVDQLSQTGDRIEGTLITHLPRTIVTRYSVVLDPATGRPSRLEFNNRLPDGSLLTGGAQPPTRASTVIISGDSVRREDQRDTMVVARAHAANAFPFLTYATVFFQLPVNALRASGRDSAMYAIYAGGRTATPFAVVRRGANRYTVYLAQYPWDVTTDNNGVIQTVDGARTTQHYVATRQRSIDAIGLASAWALRERGPQVVNLLSTRDTTRATIGAAELWVDYGRPMLRGRRVFGPTGVLNDTIWRTGANAATQFRTSVPLMFSGLRVPAGTYTLWTLAIPGRYQLIVNRQVGQWGTVYDPRQDLVRVPLQARPLPQPVEQFTIAIDAMGSAGGILRLRWDTTELSVPITVP